MLVILMAYIYSQNLYDRYFPHLIHSCSQPTHPTFHFFWGRADLNSNLIFLEKQGAADWETSIVQMTNCKNYKQVSSPMIQQAGKFQLALGFAIQGDESGERMSVQGDSDQLRLSWRDRQFQLRAYENGNQVSIGKIGKISYGWNDSLADSSLNSWKLRYQKQFTSSGSLRRTLFAFIARIQFDSKLIAELKFKLIQMGQQQMTHNLQNQYLSPQLDCAEAAYSELKKGQSYSYGVIRVSSNDSDLQKPRQIFSMTPSRSRFPWSFLWDDGFHLEVLVDRQPQLVVKIIQSWLDTSSKQGWIPRQQSRGAQRQLLCECPEALVKDVRDGNPPSLIRALQRLKRTNSGLIQRINFKQLQTWFNWYMDTQREDKSKLLFKWFDHLQSDKRCGGSVNSGIDDFPRTPFDRPDWASKYHVDAQSWMYYFAKVMADLAPDDRKSYYQSLSQNIRQQAVISMLDPSDNLFKDVVYNPADNKTQFSEHLGYTNVLALALGLIPAGSPSLLATLKLMQEKQNLNSGFGLRSLSKNSPLYYQNKDAYWRGPIWINVNYLVIFGINSYYSDNSQLQSFALELKQQLISTVCGNWKRTGYFFQNYDGRSGEGSWSRPFTGWTTLISRLVWDQSKVINY